VTLRTITFLSITALASSNPVRKLACVRVPGRRDLYRQAGGRARSPAINSNGSATFKMTIGPTITFTLTFSGLSSNAILSHLHFG
jgi:hypothetical protein